MSASVVPQLNRSVLRTGFLAMENLLPCQMQRSSSASISQFILDSELQKGTNVMDLQWFVSGATHKTEVERKTIMCRVKFYVVLRISMTDPSSLEHHPTNKYLLNLLMKIMGPQNDRQNQLPLFRLMRKFVIRPGPQHLTAITIVVGS